MQEAHQKANCPAANDDVLPMGIEQAIVEALQRTHVMIQNVVWHNVLLMCLFCDSDLVMC